MSDVDPNHAPNIADSFNSFLAATFNTFPNTTFAQNNVVIQLTGVASRRVVPLLFSAAVTTGGVVALLLNTLMPQLPGAPVTEEAEQLARKISRIPERLREGVQELQEFRSCRSK
jgi:xanthine/uracil permease